MSELNVYVCTDCREEFDEPGTRVEREYIDYGPSGYWAIVDEIDVCPSCGSENFDPIESDPDFLELDLREAT